MFRLSRGSKCERGPHPVTGGGGRSCAAQVDIVCDWHERIWWGVCKILSKEECYGGRY